MGNQKGTVVLIDYIPPITMFFVKLLILSLCIKANFSSIVDPIEAIFDVCDVNGNDGLTLVEVQKDNCMKPLERLYGLTKLTMTKAFLKIDTNGDHIITKEEGQEAANKNLDVQEN